MSKDFTDSLRKAAKKSIALIESQKECDYTGIRRHAYAGTTVADSVVNESAGTLPKKSTTRPVQHVIVAEPTTAPPCDLSLSDITRMLPEDRARALARICAVKGAKTRMNDAIAGGKTLAQALENELDFQRAMLKSAAIAKAEGRPTVHNKEQSKKDKRRGIKPAKPAGKASFRGVAVTREVLVLAGTPLTTNKSWSDGTLAYCEIRQKTAFEHDLLASNKFK